MDMIQTLVELLVTSIDRHGLYQLLSQGTHMYGNTIQVSRHVNWFLLAESEWASDCCLAPTQPISIWTSDPRSTALEASTPNNYTTDAVPLAEKTTECAVGTECAKEYENM